MLKSISRKLLPLAGLIQVFVIVSCGEPEPVKIGYVGGVTGRMADLGKDGRDGARLAVEQANAKGGVAGRPVKLIVQDDKQDRKTARTVVARLIEQDVDAIIGHMTSSMSISTIDLVNQHKVLMISPTTSTELLTGIDDYFLRIYPSSREAAGQLAKWMSVKMNKKSAVAVYDRTNDAHTTPWLTAFSKSYTQNKGDLVKVYSFSSGNQTDFLEITRNIATVDASAVFILANALDTAFLVQNMRKTGDNRPVFATEWSATPDLLRHGGGAVEGMNFLHTFDQDSQKPSFLDFKSVFIDRFHRAPSFASVHAYDVARVLLDTMENMNASDSLKELILSKSRFSGLQTEFSFNRFGDVQRSLFPMKIVNGQFTPVQ